MTLAQDGSARISDILKCRPSLCMSMFRTRYLWWRPWKRGSRNQLLEIPYDDISKIQHPCFRETTSVTTSRQRSVLSTYQKLIWPDGRNQQVLTDENGTSCPFMLKFKNFKLRKVNISQTYFVPSQQRGSFAGASQRWWGFAPQLFALQADGLGRHQSRGREVVGGGLLLMSAVDVTGDEEGDLPDLWTKQNRKGNVSAWMMVCFS